MGSEAKMKVIYKVTYPNGKIYREDIHWQGSNT